MKEFIISALPLVVTGICVAIICATYAYKKDKNYITEGMGMGMGMAFLWCIKSSSGRFGITI
ncbi:MAG: hypothetical protein Q4G58_10750 [bacterium]|nr:hypothetical protein [bacterium]